MGVEVPELEPVIRDPFHSLLLLKTPLSFSPYYPKEPEPCGLCSPSASHAIFLLHSSFCFSLSISAF